MLDIQALFALRQRNRLPQMPQRRRLGQAAGQGRIADQALIQRRLQQGLEAGASGCLTVGIGKFEQRRPGRGWQRLGQLGKVLAHQAE